MPAINESALATAVRLIKSGDGKGKAKEIFDLMGLDFESELNKLWALIRKEWAAVKFDESSLHHAILEIVYGVNVSGSVRYVLSVSSLSPPLKLTHLVVDSGPITIEEFNGPLEWPGKGFLLDMSRTLGHMTTLVEGVELSSFSTDLNFYPPTQGQVRARCYESIGDYSDIYAIGFLQELISIDNNESFYMSSDATFYGLDRRMMGGMGGQLIDEMKRGISLNLISASTPEAAVRTAEMKTGEGNPFRKAMVKLMHCDCFHPQYVDWRKLYKVHKRAVDMRPTLSGGPEPYDLTPEDWEYIEAVAVGLEAAHVLRTTYPSTGSAPVIACDAASTLFWHCEQLKAKTATPGPIADVAEVALRRWEGIIFSGRTVLALAMCMLPWVRFKGIKAVFPSQSLAGLERELLSELAHAGDSPVPADRTSPLDIDNPMPRLDVDKPTTLHAYLHSPTSPPHPSTSPQRSEQYLGSRYPVKDWVVPDRDGLEYFGMQLETYGVYYHIARLGISILSTPVITFVERARLQGEESESHMRKRLIKTSLDGEDLHRMWTLHEELNRNPGPVEAASQLGKRRRED